MDISRLTEQYTQGKLEREDLDADPFRQFEQWFAQARETEMKEPTAMMLATVTPEGAPSQRTVLLKSFDAEGFVFYTNYNSAKAQHIAQNPQVSLIFPWLMLERQVIILGKAEKLSTAKALKYFASRPRGSQMGAWISPQSQIISSRSLLEQKLEEVKRKFADGQIPLPNFWGGYRIVPHSFEFWQGRANRLHDRFRYARKDAGEWSIDRLAP